MYTRIALRALEVSYSDLGEGGVAVNCEKTQFFLNTLLVWEENKRGGILKFEAMMVGRMGTRPKTLPMRYHDAGETVVGCLRGCEE